MNKQATDPIEGLTEEDTTNALALYVILSRDAGDFIDMLRETRVEALQYLLLMLETQNPKQSKSNEELNQIGANLVRRHLESRKRGKAS